MERGHTTLKGALRNIVNAIGFGNVMMRAQDLKLRLIKKGEKYIFYIPNTIADMATPPLKYQLIDEEEVVGILMSEFDVIDEITGSFEVEVQDEATV